MEALLNFRSWTFAVDKEATEAAYETLEAGSANNCICDDCRNYTLTKQFGFPSEILQLFTQLGIEYTKENEIMSFGEIENSLCKYYGCFQFQGRIIGGFDCEVPLTSGGFTYELSPITDAFCIGFTAKNLAIFPKIFKTAFDLVQIEFTTLVPWSIS